MKALEDPSSELAQQLLASEEMENERREPWWESSAIGDADGDGEAETVVERVPRRRYGERPQAIRIPASMVKPPHGPPLLYNMCALWYVSLSPCRLRLIVVRYPVLDMLILLATSRYRRCLHCRPRTPTYKKGGG